MSQLDHLVKDGGATPTRMLRRITRRDFGISVLGGLTGAAVIATDAVLSVVIGLVRLAVFGVAGVATAKVIAVALLIGVVTLPGAFLARLVVERLPIHVHTAMLDVVVAIGGVVMITGAVGKMG